MNFSRFISRVSAARTESPIRKTTAIALQNPDLISLASGMPNPQLFPFESAEIISKDGQKISLFGSDMNKALQYSSSQGIPDLLDWVRMIHKKYHNPPMMKLPPMQNGLDACVTTGSQDGLIKVFEMLTGSGDNVLVENPCYSGTLAMLKPMDCNLLPVQCDEHGMLPDSLRSVLQQWKPEDASDPTSDIPKVLYTVPTGGNPTGSTCTLERKKEIYKISQMYNMVIIEDDPYYFLQFKESSPSYQALDVDGRVIRCDSMSKVMSSGLRLGWITAAYPFIQRLIFHQQASILHTSTFVQMMVCKLLDQWGMEGFEKHVKNVQTFYKSQRDICMRSMERWLSDLAEWAEPQGGMFVWIKLKGINDTTALIQKRALEKKVLLLPGSVFEVEGASSAYCRASYSFATEDSMNEAFRRLAQLIKEEHDRRQLE